MIGQAAGVMVSTSDLQGMQDREVSIDHQRYTVLEVKFFSSGRAVVFLEPVTGDTWELEVGREDYDEPMWELV